MSVLGSRPMWLFVFFDLPVKSKQERKHATRFRNSLLKNGYIMLQYSVYARPCLNLDNLKKHKLRLNPTIPPQGSIRVLSITDLQFGYMEEMINTKKFEEEKDYKNSEQLLLF